MVEKVPVGLDVRNTSPDPVPGYTQTTATNGAIYYYKYSGGSDGKGNVTVKKTKPAKITVTVGSDPRYTVCGAFVENDWQGDISGAWSGTQAIIDDDAADSEADMEYTIRISDSTAKTTFNCDPKITNIP